MVVVILVVLLLVGGVLSFLFLSAPPAPVQVFDINFYAPDNVCDLNTDQIGYLGFNGSLSTNTTIDFGVPNYNSTACTIHGIGTNTTGFTLYNVQVPRTIPGMSTVQLNVTIKTPASKFAGNLNLILR